MEKNSSGPDRFRFLRNNGEWRWKRKAKNGKQVGASTEGYKNFEDCFSNALRNGMIIGIHHIEGVPASFKTSQAYRQMTPIKRK